MALIPIVIAISRWQRPFFGHDRRRSLILQVGFHPGEYLIAEVGLQAVELFLTRRYPTQFDLEANSFGTDSRLLAGSSLLARYRLHFCHGRDSITAFDLLQE